MTSEEAKLIREGSEPDPEHDCYRHLPDYHVTFGSIYQCPCGKYWKCTQSDTYMYGSPQFVRCTLGGDELKLEKIKHKIGFFKWSYETRWVTSDGQPYD